MEKVPEPQYYSIVLKLNKSFLMYINSHRLTVPLKGLSYDDPLYNLAWAEFPAVIDFDFGGSNGMQFQSAGEVDNFLKAFDKLLDRKGVDSEHRAPLLYIMAFFFDDFVKQAIQKSTTNRLKDYSDFISTLYMNGLKHIERMERNDDYVAITSPHTGEKFFSKKHLADSLELEDLAEYAPDEKNSRDIIRYLSINIGVNVIYIPKDLVPTITSSSNLKTLYGENLQAIDFPSQFRHELLKFTVKAMMQEHKNAQTEFFKIFQEPGVNLRSLKALYNSYKKHKFSNVRALTRVGIIVSDYLLDNKLLKSKIDIADFLWEYFALFKAFDVGKVIIPTDYIELPHFYIKKGISKESLRLMMKDAHTFGDF